MASQNIVGVWVEGEEAERELVDSLWGSSEAMVRPWDLTLGEMGAVAEFKQKNYMIWPEFKVTLREGQILDTFLGED